MQQLQWAKHCLLTACCQLAAASVSCKLTQCSSQL